MYAGHAGAGKPSYLVMMKEGFVDKGADIADLSFYPHEKEKLYVSLSLMECWNARVEGALIVLEMRCNINTRAGTLDEMMNEKSESIVANAEMLSH